MHVPSHVARKLREVLGPEAGEDFVTWMDETAAVRADLAELRHDMQVAFARFDAGFAAQRGQFTEQLERTRGELGTQIERTRGELTAHIERTRGDLTAQIEQARGELTAKIEGSKSDLMKWSFVFWVGAVGAIAALAGVL